ncbi:MAG: hypothetical protein AAFY88_27215 [Acidobacteriota bacterium]
MAGTALFGKKIDPPGIDFAVPIDPPKSTSIWDRFGLWVLIAVMLIIAAYAVPLYHLYTSPSFGSPGFKPF